MPDDVSAAEDVQVRGEAKQAAGAAAPQAVTTREGEGRGLYSRIRGKKRAGSRIVTGSPLYRWVLPVVILAMGLLTSALILFAAGVLLGIVPFR
jgi:hypothetical protein